jgi:hypothetical protein
VQFSKKTKNSFLMIQLSTISMDEGGDVNGILPMTSQMLVMLLRKSLERIFFFTPNMNPLASAQAAKGQYYQTRDFFM